MQCETIVARRRNWSRRADQAFMRPPYSKTYSCVGSKREQYFSPEVVYGGGTRGTLKAVTGSEHPRRRLLCLYADAIVPQVQILSDNVYYANRHCPARQPAQLPTRSFKPCLFPSSVCALFVRHRWAAAHSPYPIVSGQCRPPLATYRPD